MKTIAFQALGLAEVSLNTHERLLDALIAREVKVKMLCKGRGLCATCHVIVTRNPQSLSPPTAREQLTLAVLTGAQANSRLACQAKVVDEGVELALPRGLYVESFNDLEKLVGKRTADPILHPISGRVLIEANKIITRTAIMQLQSTDFTVSDV